VVYTRYIQPLGIYMVYTWYIPPDYIPRRGSRCMTLDVSCWHRGTAGPVTPWPGRFAAAPPGPSRPPPTRPGRGGHSHGHGASARPLSGPSPSPVGLQVAAVTSLALRQPGSTVTGVTQSQSQPGRLPVAALPPAATVILSHTARTAITSRTRSGH
jgi:hypothetical protein